MSVHERTTLPRAFSSERRNESRSHVPGRGRGLGTRSVLGYSILTPLLVMISLSTSLSAPPLRILLVEEDQTAGTLVITGVNFGPAVFQADGVTYAFPSVTLAGVPLEVQSYTPQSEIVALLPLNIQPGTFSLEVASESDIDDFAVTVGGTTDVQLLIRGVEITLDRGCDTCGGTIIISGLNLGGAATFEGIVTLFVPTQGETELAVTGFDPLNQEIVAELPPGLNAAPGSYLLQVSTGSKQNESDSFQVTIEADYDPTNELQRLHRTGDFIELTDGGFADVRDQDADPLNETNLSLDFDGIFLSITDAGGTLTSDLSSLLRDGDSDPFNEIQSLARTGSMIELSHGGGFVSIDDADADPTNELQSLSVSAENELTLSLGGGTVPLNPDILTTTSLTALGKESLLNQSGVHATAVGASALRSNTSGQSNTAVGFGTLQQNATGSGNTAVGSFALQNNNAVSNTAIGLNALQANSSGSANTAVGVAALSANQTATDNVALGMQALSFNTTGSGNTALGRDAMLTNKTGIFNTAVGRNALRNSTGGANTAIGFGAGIDLLQGDRNVYIHNPGSSNESGTIRIGQVGAQDRAFIAGVRDVSLGADAQPVVIDSNGQLGTGALSSAGNSLVRTIVVSPVPGDPIASGSVLLSAVAGISDAGQSNPYLVRLEPGIFDIGTEIIDLPSSTYLQGSGAGLTQILGRAIDATSSNCNCRGPMVISAGSQSGLLGLTIAHIDDHLPEGLGSMGAVVVPDGSSIRLSDVVVSVGRFGYFDGTTFRKKGVAVSLYGSSAFAEIENLTIFGAKEALVVVSGAAKVRGYEEVECNRGIAVVDGSLSLNFGSVVSLYASGSAQVTASNSTVPLIFGSSGQVVLLHSMYTGPEPIGAKCVNSYDALYEPLSASCGIP